MYSIFNFEFSNVNFISAIRLRMKLQIETNIQKIARYFCNEKVSCDIILHAWGNWKIIQCPVYLVFCFLHGVS